MWKKEGWTQQNPVTAETFAETAMDFCSRHSFDKPPQAPRPPGATAAATTAAIRPTKRPMHEMSEDEQLQAAMRASLGAGAADDDDNDNYEMDDDDGDDDDDDVQYLGTNADDNLKPKATEEEQKPKERSLFDELLDVDVGKEPADGARIQLRMPDGKRSVRKFDALQTVKAIYAFVAVSTCVIVTECSENWLLRKSDCRLTHLFRFHSNPVKENNSSSWRGSHQRI